MKKNYFPGGLTVFKFTLTNQVGKKSYIALTVIVSILLFAIVFGIMVVPNFFEQSSSSDVSLRRVTVIDETEEFENATWLTLGDPEAFPNVEYEYSTSTHEQVLDSADEYSLVLIISKEVDSYDINIVSPKTTELTRNEIAEFSYYVNSVFRVELLRISGIDPSVINEMNIQIQYGEYIEDDPTEVEVDPVEKTRDIINMALSYITIFILYFMVVFFGQSVATSVILEKTSKLMDFFILAIKPSTMILGKITATATAALIQVLSWLAGAILGFFAGMLVLQGFFPNSEALDFIKNLSGLSGILNPAGIFIAIIMIIVGFLMYCSLAAIGGAMASKQEDLSSTNIVFTLSVVASFFLSMYAGETTGMVSSAKWLIYFPFTAIMVTPGRAMTGSITISEGIISIGLVAILAYVAIILAGRIYEMMSFYRGNPPTPAKIFGIIRDSLSNKTVKKHR